MCRFGKYTPYSYRYVSIEIQPKTYQPDADGSRPCKKYKWYVYDVYVYHIYYFMPYSLFSIGKWVKSSKVLILKGKMPTGLPGKRG